MDSVWSVVTAASEEPVSVAEATAHSYITATNEDVMIARFLAAARTEFEDITNMACISTTFDESFEAWPADGFLELSRWPLTSVTSVKYIDSGGDENTLSTSYYHTETALHPGRITLNYNYAWPTGTLRPGYSITVRYVAGYANANAVPQEIKSLILMAFGALYENRESIVLQPGLTLTQIPYVRDRMLAYRRRRTQ